MQRASFWHFGGVRSRVNSRKAGYAVNLRHPCSQSAGEIVQVIVIDSTGKQVELCDEALVVCIGERLDLADLLRDLTQFT